MSVETRERPVTFKPPLVRAILAGGKTQTRRLMKPQPERRDERTYHWYPPKAKFDPGLGHKAPMFIWRADRNPHRTRAGSIVEHCPYGVPGDRLWIRESLAERDGLAIYESDESPVVGPGGEPARWGWKVRVLQARFMPRWACRLRADVTSVRAEPLRDISEDDAVAEGFGPKSPVGWHGLPSSALASFELYWDLINGRSSWEANDWVWVVGFQPIEGGAS